ncbi:MAG TPA: hypothetical protein PLW65_04650 [Pseudomonadota bacterium]|nr:hypothetical protein [Pseudomonadota bacterium]
MGETAQSITCVSDDSCALDQVCDPAHKTCLRPPATRNIDVLFLIDNSPSMAPRQKALAASFKSFMQKIEATGADYHVAVATSDVGSTVAPDAFWRNIGTSCDTFAGDDGLLQAIPCTNRYNLSPEAMATCTALCPDPKYVPSGGAFIARTGGRTNVPTALVVDPKTGKTVDEGPVRAFQCMALVGDGGCGIEGQFEGAKRALDGHRLENSGFLRPDSMLAVIFITDEDDCSVQLARRAENNPQTRDCATPDAKASYDCFNADYRCQARSLVCNEALNIPGIKTGCHERADSYLEPVQKYVDFFSSLRPSNRLFVSGIWTLPPLDGGGELNVVPRTGPSGSYSLNRLPQLCATESGGNSGAPQLRLSKLAQHFKGRGGVEVSLCDESSYSSALNSMATTILFKAGLSGVGG